MNKRREASKPRPIYYKDRDDNTGLYIIGVDNGEKHWRLCSDVEEKYIDDLIERLRSYPKEWPE